MKFKAQCPVCQTGEFVINDMSTHAGDGNGRESHDGNYLCNKCGGEFKLQYEIVDDKIHRLNIEYKDERKNM